MNARALAVNIIDKTLEQGGKSHLLLADCFRTHPEADGRDRAFITALVHGTVSRMIELDFYLAQVCDRSVRGLRPYLRSVLRMALYQLFYMDRVPASAICNESVKLVRRRLGEGLTAFTNGVLRTACGKNDWKKPEGAAACSLPEPLFERLAAEYGAEKALQIGETFLKPPMLWGRVNQSVSSCETVLAQLKEDGYLAAESDILPGAVRYIKALPGSSGLEKTKAFRNGLLQFQDISAQLAVAAAAPKPGMKVLDLCAAPGGKSLQVADLMQDEGRVLACDLTEKKCAVIRENADRGGFSCIAVSEADATVFDPEKEEAFDLVIADLPCSGLGVASRKPEIKYRADADSITELAALQRKILSNAMRYVRSGGTLLYSTCTVSREENEENASWLAGQPGMRPKKIALGLPEGPDTIRTENTLLLLPGAVDGDGFFISLFEKEAR